MRDLAPTTLLAACHDGLRVTLEAMDLALSISRLADLHRSVPAGLVLEAAEVRAEVERMEAAGLVGVA